MAPKVLSQINKSKISRVLQELSDLRRDYRIAGIETNEDSQTVDELSDLLESDYSTLEAAELPENSELYAVRTNEGGWLFYEDELYANLPNGAYTW